MVGDVQKSGKGLELEMFFASDAIWTIGHSTRTIEEFLGLLRQHEIEILVDVRHFPGSQRFPHFNKPQLARALFAAGIQYEHLVQLGGRRPTRRDSRAILVHNTFRGYADHMETPTFREGIDRLLKIARTGPTAIMCAEALWRRCHRSMIADYFKAHGARVLHIKGLNEIEEHSYTPAAQRIDGRLSYESPSLFDRV